jgi:O-methyltransferase
LLALRQRLWGAPTYGAELATLVLSASDPVRHGAIALAFRTLDSEGITGATAELGVHRGDLSVVLRRFSPNRRLYLFDTFTGFPDVPGDDRFRDTSADLVRSRFPREAIVEIRAGVFPETASGLEHERFAFVMLDADRYQVTADGLRFFYPRLVPGGYLFIHDYNSSEFAQGAFKACQEFMASVPERPIELPDFNGSVVFRRSAI